MRYAIMRRVGTLMYMHCHSPVGLLPCERCEKNKLLCHNAAPL